jgi:hypothetical protein
MQPIGYLFHFSSIQITLAVILLMIIFYWIGHLIVRWKNDPDLEGRDRTVGVIEGSLLGLLALILGFTFSISNSRYEKRMDLIVQESNNIGTAILRADMWKRGSPLTKPAGT